MSFRRRRLFLPGVGGLIVKVVAEALRRSIQIGGSRLSRPRIRE